MLDKKCTAELIVRLIIDMNDFDRFSKDKRFIQSKFKDICCIQKECSDFADKTERFENLDFLNDYLNDKNKKYRGR